MQGLCQAFPGLTWGFAQLREGFVPPGEERWAGVVVELRAMAMPEQPDGGHLPRVQRLCVPAGTGRVPEGGPWAAPVPEGTREGSGGCRRAGG